MRFFEPLNLKTGRPVPLWPCSLPSALPRERFSPLALSVDVDLRSELPKLEVKRTYRKRFGIETSYRQMNQCRIRTTTKRFNVRFLYLAIGLLLRNLWVWLHHVVLSTPRRGCRRYNWARLRVKRMLLWLEKVAYDLCGLVLTVPTERAIPESVVT